MMERSWRAAYLMTAPALLLFVGVVLVPLAMTVLLAFHDWDQYKGIQTVFILKNWREIWSDSYFTEVFARTFRMALLVTVFTAVMGAPEAELGEDRVGIGGEVAIGEEQRLDDGEIDAAGCGQRFADDIGGRVPVFVRAVIGHGSVRPRSGISQSC